jgi:hypothetical protein
MLWPEISSEHVEDHYSIVLLLWLLDSLCPDANRLSNLNYYLFND